VTLNEFTCCVVNPLKGVEVLLPVPSPVFVLFESPPDVPVGCAGA